MPSEMQSDSKSDNFWQSYGFTHNPFASSPNNNHTLLFNKWEHHLDLLQHLIRTENVLLAIFGQKGSGKTTLLQQLIAQIGETMRVYSIKAEASIDLTKILQILQEGFNLPTFDNDLLEDRLDNQIADLQFQEQTCVLLVDDAQELPLETLHALLYLIKQQSKTQMRLHAVLFGDQQLQMKLAKLAREELSGDLIHSIELEPLTLEETRLYLQHRLKGQQLFTATTIEDIYQSSHGVPERINYFAAQSLQESMSEPQMSSEPNVIKQHQTKIIGGTVLLALLALVVVLLERGEQHNVVAKETKTSVAFVAPTNGREQALVQQSLNPSNHLVLAEETEVKPVVPAKLDADSAQNVQAYQTNMPTTGNTEPAAAPIPVASPSQPQTQPSNGTMASIGRMISKKLDSSFKQAQKADIAEKPASQPSNDITANNASEELANNKPSIASLEHAMLTPTVTDVSMTEKKLQLKNHKKAAKTKLKSAHHNKLSVKKSVAKVVNPTVTNKSVMAMKPSHYTLQLIALDQPKELQRFIATNHLSGKVHTFIVHRNGRTFYVASYGQYPSQTAAKAAIKTLPLTVRKNNVWARSFGSIQKEVKKK